MLRFLGVITLLFLILSGVGFVLGWYQVSAAEGGFLVTFDTEKAKADVDKATKRVKDLTGASAAAAGDMAGTLSAIDADQRRVTLARDGLLDETLAVAVDAVITRDGERGTLTMLKVGDHAKLEIARGAAGPEVRAITASAH